MEMIRVAIVEDTDELRYAWTDILNHTEGYVCVGSFSNATDAVQQLPLLSPDIVLMDVHLSPTETGIEVIQQIKTQCLNSQFLMFTIFENDAVIFESLKAGASGYILKNTSATKVLAAIRELHEGGSPMSASIARRVLQSFQPEKAPSPRAISISPPPQYDPILYPQERHILELLAKGLFYKEVAEELNLTVNTVKQYCHSIYKKLEVANRTEAVNKYFPH
jgi:DNA-binding NarL/FixJ family response regulator